MKSTIYLKIICYQDYLKISCYESGETLRSYEKVVASMEMIEKHCKEMIHELNRFAKEDKKGKKPVQKIQEIGRMLTDELLSPGIKNKIEQSTAEFLILDIDEKLVHIQWELLYLGNSFLCKRFSMGRLVETQEKIHPYPVRNIQEKPLKMWIIANPGGDLGSADIEGKDLFFNMEKKKRNEYSIIPELDTDTTKDQFKLKLKNYDLIHYAGHVKYIYEDPSQSGIILSDDHMTASDIYKMIGGTSMSALFFFNACQSARSKPWVWNDNGNKSEFDLAHACLKAGVQNYIGTFWDVIDEPGSQFAFEVYHYLLSGLSIGESIKNARNSFSENDIVCWATYIMYGDPRVNYFSTHDVITKRPSHRKPIRTKSTLRGWMKYAINTESIVNNVSSSWLFSLFMILLILSILGLYLIFFFYGLPVNQEKPSENSFEVKVNQNDIKVFKILNQRIDTKRKKVALLFSRLKNKWPNIICSSPKSTDNWTSVPTPIAVIDCPHVGGVYEGPLIQVAIQRYVLKHAKQFKVMEKKDLDVILEELIQSSEKPESCIFLPEFHIFHGYIKKASTVFLYMKLTDKVGEVIDIAFESFSSEQLYPKLDKVISPFMDKLIHQHPLQGVIVDIKDDQYVLNIGSAVGVDFSCEFKVQGIKDDVKLNNLLYYRATLVFPGMKHAFLIRRAFS